LYGVVSPFAIGDPFSFSWSDAILLVVWVVDGITESTTLIGKSVAKDDDLSAGCDFSKGFKLPKEGTSLVPCCTA